MLALFGHCVSVFQYQYPYLCWKTRKLIIKLDPEKLSLVLAFADKTTLYFRSLIFGLKNSSYRRTFTVALMCPGFTYHMTQWLIC